MNKTLSPMLIGRHSMIASQHYLSSAAGARIFAAGGNAIDAAVAATLVEGIVNPHMHTIGGEAPMLIRPARNSRVVAINGNTAAPARATIDAYRKLGIAEIPGEGLLAAGAPAAFDALATALAAFGRMSLAEVMEPALELCEAGFPLHEGVTGGPRDATVGGKPATLTGNSRRFLEKWPSTGRVYLPQGRVPAPGTMISNPALARCFRRLLDAETAARAGGREAGIRAARDRFYRGDIAREIAGWSEAQGGFLAAEDLAAFETKIEEPVHIDYRGVRIFKCGPWSQGPVFLQQLRLLEGFELRAMGHNSAAYIHTVIEAAKLAFADRDSYYGDPGFVDVPMEGLLSTQYAAVRRKLIDAERALLDPAQPGDPATMSPLSAPAPDSSRPWGRGTVHVAAGDGEGNLVAVTPSGGWIPSSPVIEELGFPLGTRLQTFSLTPGHPNALAPGKRPRTTLSPSLALWDDEHGIAFGTMGGDNQDQWTLQFFLNLIDFGMELQQAIEAPRFSTHHFPSSFSPHAVLPGTMVIEERVSEAVRAELARRGHRLVVAPAYSEGYVLAVEGDAKNRFLRGGADPRGFQNQVFPACAIGW